MRERITKVGEYTVIEHNVPTEEELDKIFEIINKDFEFLYGKVEKEHEKET